MIWTVTLNAVVDHIYQALSPEGDSPVVGCAYHLPSGKGLNVSRALSSLGVRSAAIVLCGSETLPDYRAELLDLRVAARLVPGLTRTRQHATVIGTQGHDSLHLREPGAKASASAAELLDMALSDVRADDAVAFCGSVAPGLPDGTIERLVRRVVARGARVWIDTSAGPLERALAIRPYALKVNAAEIAAAIGRPVSGVEAAVQVVRELLDGGIELACITLGRAGLVLGRGEETVFAPAPVLDVVSSVGSGDAALAGLLAIISDNFDVPGMAAAAAAAGAANTLSLIPGSLDAQVFRALHAQIMPSVCPVRR